MKEKVEIKDIRENLEHLILSCHRLSSMASPRQFFRLQPLLLQLPLRPSPTLSPRPFVISATPVPATSRISQEKMS